MASCKCTNPPGGNGVCERGQIAFCRVINNECTVRCKDPRRDLVNPPYIMLPGRVPNLYFALEDGLVDLIIEWFMIIRDYASSDDFFYNDEDLFWVLDERYRNDYSLFTQAISQGGFLTEDNQIITCKIPKRLKRRIIKLINNHNNI
ncbi:MAG: hypothetical protein AAGE84_26355 [Cyanobacteria bacterium P01_G01_bin.39]